MKVLGLVCEFNPFHNGHRYLIEKAKRETACDIVIAVMSGNFVQRGTPAITDKYTRAEIAISNGVDLVLELPSAFTLHSAHYFAKKSVETLIATGVVDMIAFGSESGDISLLQKAADSPAQHQCTDPSVSTARAIAKNADDSGLYTPNNILGIEYLRALKFFNSTITPYTCSRIGVDHDDTDTTAGFASASHLRKRLYQGLSICDFAPEINQVPANLSVWEHIVLYRLRTMTADELAIVPGVSEGIQNRIINAAKEASSYDELLTLIKTKRYTRSHIERILACAVLGIRPEHLLCKPYIRVLAANKAGTALLRVIKSNMPVITKTADAPYHPVLETECRTDDVYALLCEDKRGNVTYRQSPKIKQDF